MSIKRVPETEAFIDTLDEKEIYRFMRSEFDRITKKGENYLPEHDEIVSQIASEKFGISAKEAGDLYTAVEIKISEFQLKNFK